MRALLIAFFLAISCLLFACSLQTNRNQVETENGAVASKRDSTEVYKNPGVSHFELSELDKFPVEFKEAIQVEPRAKTYRNLGGSYLEQGKVDEAIVAFKKAVQIDPNFVEAHYLLADVYSIKGEGLLSRESLGRAMALEGSYIIDIRIGIRRETRMLEPPKVMFPPEFFQGLIEHRDLDPTNRLQKR